jgi:hypothetical protein
MYLDQETISLILRLTNFEVKPLLLEILSDNS